MRNVIAGLIAAGVVILGGLLVSWSDAGIGELRAADFKRGRKMGCYHPLDDVLGTKQPIMGGVIGTAGLVVVLAAPLTFILVRRRLRRLSVEPSSPAR